MARAGESLGLATAFVALVVIQTTSSVLFKSSQVTAGRYTFNPAASMVIAEAMKLGISLVLLYREGSVGRARAARSAQQLAIAGLRVPLKVVGCYTALASGYAVNNQLTFHILRLVARPQSELLT